MANKVDKGLVSEWIQFLKNAQVAFSDRQNPGKLRYKKPVTVEFLTRFLRTKTNFSPKQIEAAIQQAIGGRQANPANPKSGPEQVPHDPNGVDDANFKDVPPQQNAPQSSQVPATQQPRQPETPQPALRGSRFNNQDAEDADYKEVPRTPKEIGSNTKPHYKMGRDKDGKPTYTRLREDFEEDPGETLDEKDVENVFDILLKQQTQMDPEDLPGGNQQKQQGGEPSPQQKQKDLNTLKRAIRDKMSPTQRKAFFRMLSDDNSDTLNEDQISKADAKALLKTAVDLRDNQGIRGSIPGLRKDKLDIGDLQKAWAKSGFPDDTRDISAILKKQFGFSDREIEKVFDKVFGKDDEDDEEYSTPAASPQLQKLADYTKEHGLADEVIAFMTEEYGEELGVTQKPSFFQKHFGKKAVAEEVRQIFTEILEEQREDRTTLIRQQEQTQLGRSKK